jgi:transcriptional regulator with XRE-family HTH domain
MTRLAKILAEQKESYTTVAERAHLQPRTVRQLATGETPIDNVAVGTVRRIAAALSLPVAILLEPEVPHPGDASLSRADRLSAAIETVMWPTATVPYRSPVEAAERDDIADRSPDEFFADMPAIDARRG